MPDPVGSVANPFVMLVKFRQFLVLGVVAGTALLSSCEQQKPAATAPGKPAATAEARYECPMSCAGSQSTQPGKCPTCGMDLEKKS